MTAKTRFRARNAERKARMLALWEVWQLATTRPERQVLRELVALTHALLTAHGELSIEALVDEHRARSGLRLKVAMAEVEQFHRDVAQRLRDGGMLVYPVTEFGFEHPVTANEREVKASVPGLGRGSAAYGWRVAATVNDPVFVAYWDMRLNSTAGSLSKIAWATQRAAADGILPVASAFKALPDSIKAV